MLLPGHVIRVFDPNTTPPKPKRVICICPQRRLFLRINSNPLWPPQHRLDVSKNNAILDHDSYVELGKLWRFSESDLERAFRRADAFIGRMSKLEALALAWSAQRAETLSEEWQNLVWERLVNDW